MERESITPEAFNAQFNLTDKMIENTTIAEVEAKLKILNSGLDKNEPEYRLPTIHELRILINVLMRKFELPPNTKILSSTVCAENPDCVWVFDTTINDFDVSGKEHVNSVNNKTAILIQSKKLHE